MTSLADTMRRELLRYVVQKQIFDPLTGEVLDMDTCVVILDADNDPVAVFSQAGWQKVLGYVDGDVSRALDARFHLDESTVRPSS